MKLTLFIVGVLCLSNTQLVLASTGVASLELSLHDAVELAHKNDPWLINNKYQQQIEESQSIVASALPDPVVSIGAANLPVDSFDFSQEAMTQGRIGVAQTFPRGGTRRLKREQFHLLSEQHPFLRKDRTLKVRVIVSHLWLEAFRAKESIKLIERDRSLFEHLVDVAQSSYSSALASTQQQDLVRAQLELTQLEDRLIQLHEHLDTSKAKLSEWLNVGGLTNARTDYRLSENLPKILLIDEKLVENQMKTDIYQLSAYLINHPSIKSLDKKIDASETGVKLAKQSYKPQWGVNANYGFRDKDPTGEDRSDLFSVGVSFDVPLFSRHKKQDKQVKVAKYTSESMKTDKAIALRRMYSSYETSRATLNRLNERKMLYSSRLLGEIHEQAEASLTAYTSDDGDFSEVVRARIAELNTQIDALNIEVDRLKTVTQINYFLGGDYRQDNLKKSSDHIKNHRDEK